MSTPEQIIWYLRRLTRMSPPEIAHRVFEQTKRAQDSRAHWHWDRFSSFGGNLQGIPGLVPARIEALRAESRREAARIGERDLELLNRQWPQTPDWNAVWQLDPLTGTTWPGAGTFAFHSQYRHARGKGDVKYVWEVNRLQFLPVLALAQEHELFAQVLTSWMSENPPFQGINWTSGIEAATRVVSLLASLSFLDDDARQRLDTHIRLFLKAHVFWIRRYPSLYSSANNHRVAELVAQFLAAVCAHGLPGSAEIRKESRAGLEDRMQHLFHPDGVGAEQSVTYAAYALEWFALAGIAADAAHASFSQTYKARAAKAADHLRWLMDDSARTPAVGDGDETRVLAFRQQPEERYAASVVALVARWLALPELSPPAHDPHIRDLWGGLEEAPLQFSPCGMRIFEEGGYTVFRERTSRGTLVCSFDHGPLGFESIAAHGHADALSIWLSWGDEPIFIDAGTYLYHSGGKERDRFRSTPVHNTLSIENADQSTIAGPFNWSRHARTKLMERSSTSVTAQHDGYLAKSGLIHRRELTLNSVREITVSDVLLGRTRRVGPRWRAGFTLAPGVCVEQSDAQVVLTTPAGRIVRIVVEQGPREMVETRTTFSPAFGQLEATSRIEWSGLLTGVEENVLRLRIECLSDER